MNVRDLETAWFGEGTDHAKRRADALAADTDERAERRAEIGELQELVVETLADRVATLESVVAESEVEPMLPDAAPRHDTQLSMAAVTDVEAAEPDPEPDPEPEPEPDPEPEPEPTPEPTPSEPAPARRREPPRDVDAAEADILPAGASGWQAEVELLYNDVLRLFSLGDTDGALVSLERLLIIAPINDQIRNFLRVNKAKLKKLYEGVMGPWSNVPRKLNDKDAPRFFSQHAKFKTLLHLVDSTRSLGDILQESYFDELETCAVLNQLIRAKVILPHDVPL